MKYTSREVYEYISKQTNDPIVEWKTCPWTGEEFAIFQWDIDQLKLLSPIVGWITYDLPTPTLSPKARMIQRMMRRNERWLYKTNSPLSNKPVITTYHPLLGYQSVTSLERMSDEFDAAKYGIDYNPDHPFIEQYTQLLIQTPKVGSITINNENGDYNTYSSDCKNVYLCCDCMRCEDNYYTTTVKYVRDGVDLLQVHNSDTVVECFNSDHLTKCMYARYCQKCYDCGFLYTCTNCTNCWFSHMINDKSDYLFNKPATPEEITAVKEQLKTWSGFKKLYDKFMTMFDHEFPRPADWSINCEDSFGSNIYDSKGCFYSFDSHDLESCRYCHVWEFNKDCMDCTIFNPQSSLNYQHICGWWWTSQSIVWTVVRDSKQAYYCEFPMHCDHILGCINLSRSSYSILNKQYSPEQREHLATQIIQELQESWQWWEFFPNKLCPFAYNDSVAMDYFPVHKCINSSGIETIINPNGHGIVSIQSDEFIAPAVLDLWGSEFIEIKRRTKDYEINIPTNADIIKAQDLADHIDQIDDIITTKVILCEETWRPYRIMPRELTIYRKLWLPIPRVHYSVRHQRRFDLMPAKTYFLRKCDKTWEELLSVYPDDTRFPVWSQWAFNKEIYGN